jgi:uncharacterized RmlC-like cupin family protein
MRDTHVLTPREAAEQTGLGLDTVMRLAADHVGVSKIVAESIRIDPWALGAAVAASGFKKAA